MGGQLHENSALLPAALRQFRRCGAGVLADPLQDIDQVIVRVDIVESAGGEQTLHDADLFGAQFRPSTCSQLYDSRNGVVGWSESGGQGRAAVDAWLMLAAVSKSYVQRISIITD
jgi:hypothetical protein